MQLVDIGEDYTTLFGSRLAQNDNFLFVSGNGYNIYNGLVTVYHNNFTTDDDGRIQKFIHSTITSPNFLNLNFGTTLYATNEFLFVGGISYDVYHGIVYIFKYKYNRWLLIQTLTSSDSKNLLGFGNHIFVTNKNTLNIGTFYGEIYKYSYNEYNENFIFENILESVKKLDVNNIILSDGYDNIILWHLSLLQAWNYQSQTWIELDNISNCLKIEINNNKLYMSCNDEILVYDIIYDINKNIQQYNFYQTIHIEESYFAKSFYVGNDILLITGNNNIYHYEVKNKLWELKENYLIQNDITSDYVVQLVNDYIAVGNYEFNDLQGALWLYKMDTITTPDTSNVNNINNINISNFLFNRIGLCILLLFLGCAITIFLILFCYYLVYLLTPKNDDKKKKDKEEEESPYKVYSYIGYVETDDVPPIIYPSNQTPYYFYYPTTPTILNSYVNTDMNKPNGEKEEYVTSNEKVASYKGYTYDYIKQQYQKNVYPILQDIKDKKKNI
jgi:hypothetical protein